LKVQIDIEKFPRATTKDRMISFRLTEAEYSALKTYDKNVSRTVRALIAQFCDEVRKAKFKWSK
jgi:hypothetical protein